MKRKERIEKLLNLFNKEEKSTATKGMISFFESVEKQYDKNGDLSDKQIQAMENIYHGSKHFRNTVEDGMDLIGVI